MLLHTISFLPGGAKHLVIVCLVVSSSSGAHEFRNRLTFGVLCFKAALFPQSSVALVFLLFGFW
uniref:Uncharacterized protein n=1 Tax=Physcomitrium patens TaxID=3218 RepID=A0A2K1K7Q1_PHYPA|nr:hypothetical protein PHYPA_011704 [Physcomitrium patens]